MGPVSADCSWTSLRVAHAQDHELYDGRLKKHPGAVAFRIRWYGAEESMDVVFLERKTHEEDWYGDGPASAKEPEWRPVQF